MKIDKIAIIGQGYVGLPLAVAFAKLHPTIGFDTSLERVEELISGFDRNNEFDCHALGNRKLTFSNQSESLRHANVYIVTVPTPVHSDHKPDLTYLLQASHNIGSYLKKGDLVVFESTVYPGVTEEECLPILEAQSGLSVNDDFGLGYSPERINPGDKKRKLKDIIKVTSGSNDYWSQEVNNLYQSIISAGTHLAPSIKVAEAAKVIENTQRDLNIALVNQLAQLFTILNIDTKAVLDAASTKWNFLSFSPGLVGGHCIGVDPYYLCHKAETVGYIPDIILAGRRLNDGMPVFIAQQIVKAMSKKKISLHTSNVLILGITFKEDCPDIRNSKVVDLAKELENYACTVSIYDPLADKGEVNKRLGLTLINDVEPEQFDTLVLAVPHSSLIANIDKFVDALKPESLIYDLKGVLPENYGAMRL